MSKRYFYVKGDDKKTPVDLSKQTKGAEIVCVAPSGEEMTFKVGEKFVNLPVDSESSSTTPEAQDEVASLTAADAARASMKAKRVATATAPKTGLSVEEKMQKMEAAKAKAQALKMAKHVANPLKAKP